MSTWAYAALTTTREKPKAGIRATEAAPGVSTYVDALAALVPAETLALHGVILSFTTKTANSTTEITQPTTLFWSFWGLLVVSAVIYVAARVAAKKWDRLDWARMFIPALAFVGWTMLQRATAFDAIPSGMTETSRTVLALFLGVVLGIAASALGYQADQKGYRAGQRKAPPKAPRGRGRST